MDWPRLRIARLAFTLMMMFLSLDVTSQNKKNEVTAVKNSVASDLERQGLRGLVQACTEEHSYPGSVAPDGTSHPEIKSRQITKYDRNGRILSSSSPDPDGEWNRAYTYDSSGRLQKIAFGKRDEKPSETVYTYDEDGKLLKISGSEAPDNPTVFHYDEHGRKTEVRVFRPEDYRPNVAVVGPPFESLAMTPNLAGGGTATTIYDEHDRATEVRLQDASGTVVKRAVRVYDSEGRITEEKQVLDSPEMIIPAEMRAQILAQAHAESGESAEALQEQLRAELSKLMGGQSGPYSLSHSYDDKGRIEHTTRRIFNHVEKIDNTYNAEGDLATEITRSTEPVGPDGKNLENGPPTYSEVRHTYKYDDHGNWTAHEVSYRNSQEGNFELSTVTTRTLTYF
jgi:YD repeat-containing protein